MPQIAKLSDHAKKVKLLAVQVIHPGMLLPSNAAKGGGDKTLMSQNAAIRKADCKMTDEMVEQSGCRLDFVVDKLSSAEMLGKTTGEYGASLGTWVLLDRDRHVLAVGSGPKTLEEPLRKLEGA